MGNEQMTEYKQKYDDLTARESDKAKKLAVAEERLKNVEEGRKSDGEVFKVKIDELSAKNTQLTAQLETCENKLAQLTEMERTLENEKMALEGRNKSLTSDVERLKKQAGDEKKANADHRETLVGLKDQIKEGEMKIMQLSKEVKCRDETLTEEKEKSALKSKLKAELKVSKDKNSEQANEITALTMQLNGTKTQITHLQSAINKSNEERDKLSNESKSITKDLSVKREETAALVEQVKALKGQLDTEKTNNSKLNKTCDELKREIKEETAKGNNAQIKETALEKDAESMTMKTQQQQATIDSLQEEARLYKETVEDLRNKLRETEEAPKEREIDVKVLETEKSILLVQLDEQKQATEASSLGKEKLLEDNSDLRETVARLKEQVSSKEKEGIEVKERMQRLEKDTRAREKELSEKHEAHIATIRKEHDKYDELREKHNQTTTEIIKEMQCKAWDVMQDQNKGVRNCLEQTSDHLRTLTEQTHGVVTTCLQLKDKEPTEED